uniref:Uncharacterized protein n=1 Tax=Romanomermis culicivorax TaxID=13658 RepID=A0A915I7V8_ROMCU
MLLSFGTFGFIGYYDLKILNWLRKNRQAIKTIDNRHMFKHEVKLFLQCLFTGCCFMGVIGTYMMLNVFMPSSHRSLWCYLLMDISWLLNHSINPLIYWILNNSKPKTLGVYDNWVKDNWVNDN